MEAIPDYRTKEQIALQGLRSRVYSLGYTFTITRRQGFVSHAELEADFTKEGYNEHFYGEAQGKNRMKAFIAAEIIMITNFLMAIGEVVDFGEKCIEEVDEIEPQFKVDRLTVLNTRHVKDIYRLLERDSEKYEALKAYQDSLIKVGQRLNPKKAAEFLFPLRKANRIDVPMIENKPQEGVNYSKAASTTVSRSIVQMIAFEKWLKEKGVTSLNYIEKIGKTLVHKYPNFEGLCKSATEDEINTALSNN
jgi:hypothetical protein